MRFQSIGGGWVAAMDGTRVRSTGVSHDGRGRRNTLRGRSVAEVPPRRGGSGWGDAGHRAEGGGGSRTFGDTNGVTGSGSERIAGGGGGDGERGGVPGSASWSGRAIIAESSGDRGGSGGGGGGGGDAGATSAVPVDPDDFLGVFFRGEKKNMATGGDGAGGSGRNEAAGTTGIE